MAILTSVPSQGNDVTVYDIPEDVIQQYALTGDKAAQMFPEQKANTGAEIPKASGSVNATKIENAESLGEVQAYNSICICRQLFCNHWRCWWHYYYCYC